MGSHPQNFLSESRGQRKCRAIEAISPEQKQIHNAERNTTFRGKTESYVLSICCPQSFFFFSAIINSVRISHLHGYLFKNVLYIPAVVLLSLPDFDKFFLSICMNASRVISD